MARLFLLLAVLPSHLNFDQEWEQDVAKLRVRAAQEIAVLEEDVLAFQQHASWEKRKERDARYKKAAQRKKVAGSNKVTTAAVQELGRQLASRGSLST
jgi:hypothetical protein